VSALVDLPTLVIDAVQYGITRPGATLGEHRLPTLAP
jgi:hypothetical protein